MASEEKWDFMCGECGWTGLVDECFYDDDNDGLAMCPECDSKDMELWSDSNEFKG